MTPAGRARIPFRDAIVESRSLLRSASIAVAQSTRKAGRLNRVPWLQVLFSRRHRDTVALILDRKDAEAACRFLKSRWSSGIVAHDSATGSNDSVGGTCPEPDCFLRGS